MLFDTHFHLDLMDNMQMLTQEFRKAGVGVFSVGTTPKSYERELLFFDNMENIKVGLGLHPQLIAERGQEIDLFLKLVKSSKYIGEIGLDFNSAYITSKDQQLSCFRQIAKICADIGNKVLSIHSVKAAGVVIDELDQAGTFKNNICIFHWFTGTATERKRAVMAGAWFSINPRMLKTRSGQETIIAVPTNRLLLETDAPFALRIGTANKLRVELEHLQTRISELRGMDLGGIINDNSRIIWGDQPTAQIREPLL